MTSHDRLSQTFSGRNPTYALRVMTVIDVIILTPPQSSKQLGLYLSVHGNIAWRAATSIRSGSFFNLFIVLLAPEHLRWSSWGFHWHRTIIKCDWIIHVFIPSVLWEVRLLSYLVIFDPKKNNTLTDYFYDFVKLRPLRCQNVVKNCPVLLCRAHSNDSKWLVLSGTTDFGDEK